MKEYVRLSVYAQAYYSGQTYSEEVFLPLEMWEKIKDDFQYYTYITELDGKHSETRVDIEVDFYNEDQLVGYLPCEEDGETLFYHIYDYLPEEECDDSYLCSVNKEVSSLCQVETMEIKFNKKDREAIMKLLDGYLL